MIFNRLLGVAMLEIIRHNVPSALLVVGAWSILLGLGAFAATHLPHLLLAHQPL